MKFHDVRIEETFIEDWDKTPSSIKESVDRKVSQLAIEGEFRPSANLHRVHGYDDELWIMYVNLGHGGWRMIVKVVDRVLHLVRVLDHEEMMQQYSPKG